MFRKIVQLNFMQAGGQTFLVFLCCPLLLVLLPSITLADEPPKNVLIFYSDDANLPGALLATQAIRSTLKDKWKAPIQIFDEGQDGFRIPNEKYEAELVALLKRKYEGVHFDLIFTFAPPALRFFLKHKAELFPDSPIVFIVNEQKRIADLKLENTTGVSGTIEVAPTLDLALAFHPQTERVVVVAGNASLERDLMTLAKKDFQRYEDKLAFTYLTDLTAEEMRERLAVLPDKTIIIFLSFNIDRNGKAYVSTDVLPQLAQSCNAPIYAQNQTYFGNGIVGGRLLSYEAVGFSAAEIGVRILSGESAQKIPPQTIPSVPMVDWRQLRRWGISETQIPPGSVVRYKEFSVWELYKWHIVAAISLIVLQALGIVWLLFTQAKRRQAEERSTGFAQLAESKHQALQQLTGRLLMLQDEERRRVAGELHDGLGQSLAIIKNRALIGLQDQTNHERAMDQLGEIAETATGAILEVREIAHNLRPYQLDRLGLVAAIKHMITRVSESTVLNVASDMEKIDGLLSPDAETSVYRIVQEGLNNVVKHSSATSARVEIKRDGGQLAISVHDNGKGISASAPSGNGAKGGFGLAGIAERVRLLGGSFAIDSQPSSGTILTVLLELRSGAE